MAVQLGVEPIPTEPGVLHAAVPPYAAKFKVSRAREIIRHVLHSRLTGLQYHTDATSAVAREIADEIKQRIKAEGWPRYKLAIQVYIGEQRGAGCRMGCQCFWDCACDAYASETFSNESIFCVAAAFGAYVY